MAKMRTISAAYAELKKADPSCALTQTGLRRLVLTGELQGVVRIGAKYILDLDMLEAFLSGTMQPARSQQQIGNVRKIPERSC